MLCLLAPVYSSDIAHIGPNTNNMHRSDHGGASSRTCQLIGHPDRADVALGHYFLGADTNGRDVAVRLLYGGRTSLQIGAEATLITMVFATLRRCSPATSAVLSTGSSCRALELIWAYPVVLLGIALGMVLAISGLDLGFVT